MSTIQVYDNDSIGIHIFMACRDMKVNPFWINSQAVLDVFRGSQKVGNARVAWGCVCEDRFFLSLRKGRLCFQILPVGRNRRHTLAIDDGYSQLDLRVFSESSEIVAEMDERIERVSRKIGFPITSYLPISPPCIAPYSLRYLTY